MSNSNFAKFEEPKSPSDLARHYFISIRHGNDDYGPLRLTRGRGAQAETVKTRGSLTTNDGGIAVN